MQLRHRFLSFCFVTLSVISYSQKPNIKFGHLDINQGLSQNNVMCIMQDMRGFMWFGTRDGLNKYDGYKFTIYRNDPRDNHSISSNFITALAEDSKGNIWVSTRGGGLNRYNREKDQFDHFKHDGSKGNSLSSNLLDGMYKDHNDNLWLCTEDAGIDFYDQEKKTFRNFRHSEKNSNTVSSNSVRCIFEDSDRNIWIGTYDGIVDVYNPTNQTFSHYDGKSTGTAIKGVKAIIEDSKKRIWIGTVGQGLYRFDKPNNSFKLYASNYRDDENISGNVIAAIIEDDEKKLWVGTENNGLDIFDPETETFYHHVHDQIDEKSISQNSIYSIYKDNLGTMWVGTFAGGINIYGNQYFSHFNHTSYKNSLSHNNVLCLAESSNGKLWIGTDGGGANLFDPVTKNFTHFLHQEGNKNSICGNYVLSVCEDSKGNVWFGTWANGISVYNPKSKSFKHFKNNPDDPSSLSNDNAWVIFEDHDRNVWIGTYGGGLNRFIEKNNSFKSFGDATTSLLTRQIYALEEDEKGNLWIGTDGAGVQIFNKNSGHFETLKHQSNSNSLSDDRINYIYKDENHNFWICTMSGLSFYDTKTNKFKVYSINDGLPNNVIFGALKNENGDVWISTNRGLSRLDVKTNKFTNFTPADGLQSYEFKGHAVCKSKWGAFYFGGINGFNEFYPLHVRETASEAPLVFTDFQIFNKNIAIAKDDKDPSPLKKAISETSEITLPDRNSVISFEFASLNFTGGEKKQYSYKLEGFDKDWNYIGTRHTATYTNLDPGTYFFKVRSLNNLREWSSNEATIKLIITPPFWKTWWFRILAILGVVLLAFAFYRFRINNVKAQKAKLQLLVEEQTAQLVQKNRELEQFAYVASHDLQEPLRTTSSFVDLLQKDYQGKLDAKADKYLTFITQATDRMKVLIHDLLEYSRIGRKKELTPVDCNTLVKEIIADLDVTIKENNAKVNFDNLPVINGYPTEMKQLFQNLISNAIKFHKPDQQPEISISGTRQNGTWQFVCKDNGIGIAKEHWERIFVIFQRLHTRNQYEGSGIGLANCKKIVELHGGNIWVESLPGEGSAFHFTIPNLKFNEVQSN
jgi:ligand-binding sensor domain-containing protein/signal transduction histidine kinase